MSEKHISLTWLAICFGWVGAFLIWAGAWIIGSEHLGQLAILVGAVALAATVREFFVEHDRAVKNIITVLRLGDPDEPRQLRRLR